MARLFKFGFFSALTLMVLAGSPLISCHKAVYTNCLDNARLQAQSWHRQTRLPAGIAYGPMGDGNYHAQAYTIIAGEIKWLDQTPRRIGIFIGEQDWWFTPELFMDLKGDYQ